MSEIVINDEMHEEIMRVARIYRRQAERCRESRAFLAGCAMMGAALEAVLLGFMNCYPEEAASSQTAPRTRGRIKPIANWSLADLLTVAKERDWLPSGLSLEEDWDNARASIGDYAEIVRQIRNLVHPTRYAEDFGRKRITERYLESVFEIVEVTGDHLLSKIGESLHDVKGDVY